MQKCVNTEHFKYELIDNKNRHLEWLSCVEKSTTTYSSNAILKQKATIDITLNKNEEININHRIRIYHVLNEVEAPVGTFLISIPNEEQYSLYTEASLECHSTLWLVHADKILKRYSVPQGTNVVNEVKRILARFGITYHIPDSLKTTSVHREWEIGTPYLIIINDLLKTINYTELHVNAMGEFLSNPYALPEDRPIDFTYDETDTNNILESIHENEFNVFDVHNIFVKYVDDPNINLYAKFENINPQSPTSIVNRPPNPSVEEVRDASDVQTLMDMCKKEASEESNRYNTCIIKTAINPLHGFLNCLYINLGKTTGKFVEQEWEIECVTGGVMRHICRRMVVV